MQVRSLGWEDPLEMEMATYSSILVWRLQWTEEPAGLQSMGVHRIKHNSFFRFSILVKSYGICFLCVYYLLSMIPTKSTHYLKGNSVQFSSDSQSCLTVTPGTAACQALCLSPIHGACWNSSPSSQWCHPIISSFVIPSSPAYSDSLHQVAKLLELQLHHQTIIIIRPSSSVIIQDRFPLGFTD